LFGLMLAFEFMPEAILYIAVLLHRGFARREMKELMRFCIEGDCLEVISRFEGREEDLSMNGNLMGINNLSTFHCSFPFFLKKKKTTITASDLCI
jgi:hypothetical protein